ncbi:MAG: polysaccharide deacetylase family protein [Pseudonocardia sp.]|nr:polysaccharide deacetylase family protein [Pseudonocardia sp.]
MIPVLMYHGVHDAPGDDGHFNPVYSVRTEDFARQLDWLVAQGYRTVRLDDLEAAADDRSVVLTFDDGDVSNVDVALPLLVERGLVAEFFVVSDNIGSPGWVGEDDGRVLVGAGMGVQSHSCTHRALQDLPLSELEHELVASRQALEAWTGTGVTAISLPGGRGGERERRVAVGTGYTHVLGSVPGTNREWTPGRCMQRIAVTRELSIPALRDLVTWTGLRPRRARARYQAFEGAKRVLGNSSYTTVRSWILSARGTG